MSDSLFVGVGVGTYDDDAYDALPHAPDAVRTIADLLRARGCGAHIAIPDPTEDGVRAHLRAHLPRGGLADTPCLIVMWSGHGELTPEPAVQLVARDTEAGGTPWIKAGDLASVAARSGARQILLVLDTCFSGDAGLPALGVLSRVLDELAGEAGQSWVGVLTSTLPLEPARDGVFGARLARLLADGPTDHMLQRRWSPHDAHIRLEDIADALTVEWDGIAQAPTFQRQGTARWIFPNPLYDPAAPPAIVEHLLLAARGADPGDERSFFTGRAEPIGEIVDWMRGGTGEVLVVTGPAGSGKSAIIGRIVSLSDGGERSRILAAGPLEHPDPGPGSVHAHVHARGMTPDDVVEHIDRGLVRAGALPSHDSGRNRGELFSALERADVVPLIAIDGLDEAGEDAQRIAGEVVGFLRSRARFVIGTRSVGRPSLLETLAPDHTIDLGAARFGEQTVRDASHYVAKRLAEVASDTMDSAVVAKALVRSAETSGEGVFLLARIVTAQLRETPIDTRTPGWQETLADAVGAALDRDLAGIPPLERDGDVVPGAARELLEALAWGYGAGMPDDIWATAASALSETGVRYGLDDVSWLLRRAGRYIIEAGEAGRAVYRLAHQRLVELFLPSRRIDLIEERGARLAEALAADYREALAAGAAPDEPAYLWRYIGRHAADGGMRGLAALGSLVELSDGALAPDYAIALSSAGRRFGDVGRDLDALEPSQRAVELFRRIADDTPQYVPHLANALNNLSNHYEALGRHHEALPPAEESVALYRRIAEEDPGYLPQLAGTLNNLGNRYRLVDRHADMRRPVEEAIGYYRRLVAENPIHTEMLAMVLNNLGIVHGEHGRNQESLEATMEAARLYAELGEDTPRHAADLALALTNLGVAYSRVGDVEAALEATEHAADLYRTLAVTNPRFLPNLATALNNLGNRYAVQRRHEEGLHATTEAHELYRGLAEVNAGYLPDLAMTLSNLGDRYDALKRHDDAVDASARAVELYRALSDQNPVFASRLARSLRGLAVHLREAGRLQEAVAPAEEMLELWRTLAAANPAFVGDLARSFATIGRCYEEVGRFDDAFAATREAGVLLAELAKEDPSYLPDLGAALHNFAIDLAARGAPEAAIESAEAAVQVYTGLATRHPEMISLLGKVLQALDSHHRAAGQPEQAERAWEDALARIEDPEARALLAAARTRK